MSEKRKISTMEVSYIFNDENSVLFRDIAPGEWFLFRGTEHMRVQEHQDCCAGTPFNCYDLKAECQVGFMATTLVVPIKAKITFYK